MDNFQNKVAVVTGGASGIGLGIVEGCLAEGMKVVIADIEEAAMKACESALSEFAGNFITVKTDVSKLSDIEALAQKTLDAFGGVHLLFNNAGVGAGSTIWESTLADWQWTMGVNLWSVIYGIQVFVPIMLEQDTDCHIVNTASIAGLLPNHPGASYQVTKHAVVALSEHLYFSLKAKNAKINASVLCPGWVKTKILESGRNRPEELQNEVLDEAVSPERQAIWEEFSQAIESGMPTEVLAGHVFDAIKARQFYILPHPEFDSYVQGRFERIIKRKNPDEALD